MAVYYRVDPAHDSDHPLPPLTLTAEPDAPPASPGLPEGGWRDRFVEDVIRVHGAALSRTASDVLRYYAKQTPPHDWTDPGVGPVSWGRQVHAAEALGVDPSTVRRAEKSLEALGLITWDCAANGGRRAPRGEAVPAQGLHFAPMIRQYAEVCATLTQRRKDREQIEVLRRRVSTLRGKVRRKARDAGECPDAAEALRWLGSLPKGLSRSTDVEALAGIARRLDGYCDLLDDHEEGGDMDHDPGQDTPAQVAPAHHRDPEPPHSTGGDDGNADAVKAPPDTSAAEAETCFEPAGPACGKQQPEAFHAADLRGQPRTAARSHIYTTKKTLTVRKPAKTDCRKAENGAETETLALETGGKDPAQTGTASGATAASGAAAAGGAALKERPEDASDAMHGPDRGKHRGKTPPPRQGESCAPAQALKPGNDSAKAGPDRAQNAERPASATGAASAATAGGATTADGPKSPPRPVAWSLERLHAAASPAFRAGLDARRLPDGRLSERAFHDVARDRAMALGVRPDLWGRACHMIGLAEATLAVLVLDAHAAAPPVDPIDVPPAYFAEMIARGRSGELRLDAALFAILRRGRARCAALTRKQGPTNA